MGVLITAEVENLGQQYEIELGAAAYIAEQPFFPPYLKELAPVLCEYLPATSLRLHLERDPETGRESDLWVFAMLPDSLSWQEARIKLEAFQHEWGFRNSLRAFNKVAVDFRFSEEDI